MRVAVLIVSDRNWAAPVALARNQPVAHFISRFLFTIGVKRNKIGFNDWEIEFFGEFAVAVVIGRDGHNRASSVASEDVVGDPDWDFFFCGWVDRVRAGKDASFFFIFLAFDFGFFQSFVAVLVDDAASVFGYEFWDERVFWGKDKEGCAENCVGTSSEDRNRARIVARKTFFGTTFRRPICGRGRSSLSGHAFARPVVTGERR